MHKPTDIWVPEARKSKPEVMRELADFGQRRGLDAQQTEQLGALRSQLRDAYIDLNRKAIREAKEALLVFYQTLPEIRNGVDNVLTAEQASSNDAWRLREGYKKYDPNFKHPSYGDLGSMR